ncbi:hypothetical protein [Corallococcus sp. EGB]|uniref:hypothetical protein n=1 Tax=Corallococcus sp. EGB TaxID=1521117 RepID=UPI001CBA887F|nr:hypothetical protein [Corallococcus sp. EGB]
MNRRKEGLDMRVVMICDAEGNILGAVTSPEGGLRPAFAGLPPHQRQVEIDAPDIPEDLDDAEIRRRLKDLGTRYKVDSAGRKFVAR